MGEDDHLRRQQVKRWLEELSEGSSPQELESFTMKSIQVDQIQNGFIRCKFVVPRYLTDKSENWHAGAIAVLIDDVSAIVAYSADGRIHVSVNFSISYFSPAKAQEEVEIEAKVSGHKGKLLLVVVEIRKTRSGEIVALAKQWMSSVAINIPITATPSKL